MSKLQAPDKEATVRFSVDMSESVHRKLSMLVACDRAQESRPECGCCWRMGSRKWMDRGSRSLPQRIDISKVYRTDAGTGHILFASVLFSM